MNPATPPEPPTQLGPPTQQSHRRFNPLTGDWLLVSPRRTERPWQGAVTKPQPTAMLSYDPTCYLCPGNARSGGVHNPPYTSVFAFDNDFPALLPKAPDEPATGSTGLLRWEPEHGRCRVICFHPDHSLTLAKMAVPDIARVVDVWCEETEQLGANPDLKYVQIFENRGPMMGASNPHPHCQIWATGHIPDQPLRETQCQHAWQQEHGTCLLCDTLAAEIAAKDRIVCENEDFVALVPFWAVWPFEVLVLSRRHLARITEFAATERHGLADILKQVTSRYDQLFQVSFPYSMGLHGAPFDGEPHGEWHFHAHFYPPLLRSAEIRKFMVGFEMLGMPQRDLTPETAAERLRSVQP